MPDLARAENRAAMRWRRRATAATASLLLLGGCDAPDRAEDVAWGAALAVTATVAAVQHRLLRRRRREETAAWRHVSRIGELTRTGLAAELEGWIAHEVGTPLASLLANLGAARRTLASGDRDALPDVVTAVDDARAEAERAVLALRRLRQLLGADADRREPVDVGGLAREAVRLLAAHAAAQGVFVAAEVEEALPRVRGNGGPLLHALVGLVLQAVENAAASAPSRVVVRAALSGGAIELGVSGSGAALSEVDRARLLAPFVAQRSGGADAAVGIARAVVEAHGGRLSAERPASGTLFRLVLPVPPDAASPAASAR